MSDSEDEGSEKQLKMVLIGSNEVGKTAIVKRYVNDMFNSTYTASIGVDFYLKRTSVRHERNVTIQITDVAGSALNGSMTDKYIYGAHALLLVYDVTCPGSLDLLEDWLINIKKSARKHDRPPLLALIANKADMEHARKVKSERHHKFVSEHNMMSSFVVSAKTGEGVGIAFQKIAAELLGLKLTRNDMEVQQPVVKAEIAQESGEIPNTKSLPPGLSAVCAVM